MSKQFKKYAAICIVSPYRAECTAFKNALSFEAVRQYLDEAKVPYVVGHGSWNGTLEKNFVIQYGYTNIARRIADQYGQDAILYVDSERVASLGTRDHDYFDPDEALGVFTEVAEWQARQCEAWSEIGGKYYVVK